MLALVVMLALALMTFGGTFAGFSDTEMAGDNYFVTGDLDLRVAKAGCNYCFDSNDSSYNDNCGNCCNWDDSGFRDDEPWGLGLDPCFYVPNFWPGLPYTSRI